MSRASVQSLFQTSEHKSSWRGMAVSTAVHGGLVAFAFLVVVPVAVRVHRAVTRVSVFAPPRLQPRPVMPAPRVLTSKIVAPSIVPPRKSFVAPPVVTPTKPHAQMPDAPPIKPVPPQHVAEIAVVVPPAPPVVQTGVFQPAPEPIKKTAPPPEKLQIGSFGEAQGASSGESRRQPTLVAKAGAFDSLDGHGGASIHNAGQIRESGFGGGNELRRAKTNITSIRPTAFGDATQAPPLSNAPKTPPSEIVTPIEILFKPKPAYTAEARQLHLEGEVSLEVVFQANATVRVIRVVRGLGHGLDEAATEAALRVRFKPAARGGVPIDTNATIKISFELT